MISKCPHCHTPLDVPDSAHTQHGLSCPTCGKGFTAAAGLLFRCGDRTAGESGETRIACPKCGQKYDPDSIPQPKLLVGCLCCGGVFAVPLPDETVRTSGEMYGTAEPPPPLPADPPAAAYDPAPPPAPAPAAPPDGTSSSSWGTIRTILGNLLWLYAGGLASAISMAASGLLFMITIVGIPFGVQMFKVARLCLSPFGAEVTPKKSAGCLSVGFNILWILMGGWVPAIINLLAGVIFAVTIIGIPFAKQYFKLAKLMLTPFGMEIRRAYGNWAMTLLCALTVLIIDIVSFFSYLRGFASDVREAAAKYPAVSAEIPGYEPKPEPKPKTAPVKPKAAPAKPKAEPVKPKVRQVVDRVSDASSGNTYLLMDEPEKDKVRRLRKKKVKPFEEVFTGDDGTVYKIVQ